MKSRHIIPLLAMVTLLILAVAGCDVGQLMGSNSPELETAINEIENTVVEAAPELDEIERVIVDEPAVEKPAKAAASGDPQADLPGFVPPQQVKPRAVSVDDARAIGDPNAPVTIIEYTDYQCPFCSRHTDLTFPQIVTDLVESGQVQYVFKDMPLTAIHPQAMLASEAARCVADQEDGSQRFVDMHKILFERQGQWSGRSNAAELFAGYAAETGVDAGAFTACLESDQFEEHIMDDIREAAELGINGTPAFVINGYPLIGAQPYNLFSRVVETLVAKTQVQPATT